jgi:hypothetical protein
MPSDTGRATAQQAGEDLAGDVALEAAHDLFLGLASGGASGDVVLGGLVAVPRTRAMRHKALLAPRFSRCSSVRPEDTGIGATPRRRAKDRSERRRPGGYQQLPGGVHADAGQSDQLRLGISTSGVSWASRSSISACRA